MQWYSLKLREVGSVSGRVLIICLSSVIQLEYQYVKFTEGVRISRKNSGFTLRFFENYPFLQVAPSHIRDALSLTDIVIAEPSVSIPSVLFERVIEFELDV